MRKYKIGFMYFLATLLVVFVAGCGVETVSIPGVVSVIPPQGATNVAINATISATFNMAMSAASITSTTFTVQAPGGVAVTGSVALSSNGLVATFTPMGGALAYETTYTATITTGASTPGGAELVSDYVWSFTTAAPTALTVVVTPAPFAQNVVLAAPITATFSQAMNCATLASPATTFTVTAPGPVTVNGTVTCSGAVATFTPTGGALPSYGTTYTATITTGATDVTGFPLAVGNYVWTFTTLTLPPVITAAPTVISTNPVTPNLPSVPENTNVPTNQIVTAAFSEPMDPGTIIGANFTLVCTSGTVTGGVLYAAVGNELVFTPSPNPLPASNTCTATITTGVQDATAQPMAANYTWTFMTGTGTATTAPEIVSTVPANAATDVHLNQAVSATFSEAMNPLTLTTSTFLLCEGTSPCVTPLGAKITYNDTTFIATLTPKAQLLPSTFYTAWVTNGATDTAGNPLGTTGPIGPPPNTWTFETGTAVVTPPIVLGSVIAQFGGFGGNAGMTNEGIYTVINGGSIGTTAASTLITGFHDDSIMDGGVPQCTYTEGAISPGTGLVGAASATGTGVIAIFTAPGTSQPTTACPDEGTAATFAIATEAAQEARTAYTTLQGLPTTNPPLAGNLASATIYPGVYNSASSVEILGGNLTLDAQGDPNAYFIFQIGSSLTVGGSGVGSSESVILINGAQAKNVYWAVGGLPGVVINYGGGGTMVGTIISQPGITLSSPAQNTATSATTILDGRVIALDASTTVVNTVINVPAP